MSCLLLVPTTSNKQPLPNIKMGIGVLSNFLPPPPLRTTHDALPLFFIFHGA